MEMQRGYEISVAEASPADRLSFIRKTYAHLAVAIFAFMGLEAALLASPLSTAMMEALAGSKYGWLVVMAAFVGVGWVAERWARTGTSVAMQYLGLGLYVVAEAFIFIPLLYVAAAYFGPSIIVEAGLYTALVFAGLTGTVFFTRSDFSWLRPMLMVASLAALGVIIASILFGFTLGTLFSAVMVVVAAGYILYYTSNVLHHYPVGSHVAASLALFSAVALLFWYILRILMSSRR
ncbi:MAG: Bax inhibitor-1 family protein [Myxococcaceae bacterium]